MTEPTSQPELASALERVTATLDRPDAPHADRSARVERIVAAVESDSSIQQLYSRLSAAEETSAQMGALNSELQRLASGLQAQAERLTAENSQLKQQLADLKAQAASPGAPSFASPASRGEQSLGIMGAPSFSEAARSAGEETMGSSRSAQANAIRKTLSPAMSALLTKSGIASLDPAQIDAAALDRTLSSLSVEQRIAVKAEMARAGMID